MLEGMNDWISVVVMSEAEDVSLISYQSPNPFYSPLNSHHRRSASEARVDRMGL